MCASGGCDNRRTSRMSERGARWLSRVDFGRTRQRLCSAELTRDAARSWVVVLQLRCTPSWLYVCRRRLAEPWLDSGCWCSVSWLDSSRRCSGCWTRAAGSRSVGLGHLVLSQVAELVRLALSLLGSVKWLNSCRWRSVFCWTRAAGWWSASCAEDFVWGILGLPEAARRAGWTRARTTAASVPWPLLC